MRWWPGLALAAAVFCGSAAARADFNTAMADYGAGRYAEARAQFLSMAELGDCSSQFNLGAMALKGQGAPVDRGVGAGWLQAAASNGCEQLVGNRLQGLVAPLTPAEFAAAAAVVARYGRDTLHAQGVVDPNFTCPDRAPPEVVAAPAAEYPPGITDRHTEGFVITALTIGTDGHARDPEVLVAVPQPAFAAAAIEAWLNASFRPAQSANRAVPERLQARTVFQVAGGKPADIPALAAARRAADGGDPAARYLIGLAGMLDPSLGISYARAGQLVLGAARDGNAQAQYWVGSQLRATVACHPGADGSVWLRHAADGGNPAALLAVAGDLLAGPPGAAQVAAQVAAARALLTRAAGADDYYVRKHAVALLAASPEDGLRDPPTALEAARRLAASEIRSDPELYDVVAAAYAASGDFANAVAQQDRALERAQALGWNLHALEARKRSYRSGEPWRGDLFAAP